MGTQGYPPIAEGIEIRGEITPELARILTPDAVRFVARLERQFRWRRIALLELRANRLAAIRQGAGPAFPEETAQLREEDWKIAPVPSALRRRRVEITGPTDRKMMINALNSGADVFMADFEDANSPTWKNMVQGQVNLRDAVRRELSYYSPEGRTYNLDTTIATLMVRPRGWHLEEKNVAVDGAPISASLFDFGLFMFHNAEELLKRGAAPFFYLPKLENRLEARLWNDVFVLAQDQLGIPQGTIKATVIIETILAALEMDEILYELRDHSAGLNAGRWDYIFSIIKTFGHRPTLLLPDRAQITMTVPFMKAYSQLLVKTCHARGAHAIGGMAAFIPTRKDPEVNEKALSGVRQDKERESGEGFDGTWVAHPDLVPVAREVFIRVLGDKPDQLARLRRDVQVRAGDLLDFTVPGGRITAEGVRSNVAVALHYVACWLSGQGAVAINNLMEDTATAEIARSQLWHWVSCGKAVLRDKTRVTAQMVATMVREEHDRRQERSSAGPYGKEELSHAAGLLEKLVAADEIPQFLTLEAYKLIS